MVVLAVVWCLGALLPSATPGQVSEHHIQLVHHKPLTTLPASVGDRSASAGGRARTGVSGLVESAGSSPESVGSVDAGIEFVTSPIALPAADRGPLISWPPRVAPEQRCDLRTAGRAPPLA